VSKHNSTNESEKDLAIEKAEHEARQVGKLSDALFSIPSVSVALIGAAILSIFLGYFLWAENLEAKFGFLDDHQVATWLGPGKSITYYQAKQIFRSSEALQPGTQQRYRPVYFLLRVAETYLWRDNAALWYSSRITMFVLSSLILAFLAIRFFGPLIGILLACLTWTATYWSTIWSLLGPAESYACLGVAFYLLGVVYGLSDSVSARTRTWAIYLMSFGSLLAAGSKENFAALALPTMMVIGVLIARGTAAFGPIVASVASIAFNLFVLIAVAKGTASAGKDIYEQNVNSSRVAKLIFLVNGQDSYLIIFLALAAVCILIYINARRSDSQDWRTVLRARLLTPVSILLALLILYASQLVFYNGAWDPNSRYAFPGELLYWGSWLVLFYLLDRELQIHSPAHAYSLRKLFSLVLAGLIFWYGFENNRAFAAANKLRTTRIQASVDRAGKALSGNPNSYLVLYSATLNDYESIFALKVYLNNKGLENRVMLQLASPYAYQAWPKDLAAAILPHMEQSSKGQLGGFIPLNLDSPPGLCHRLILSGSPPKDACESLGFVLD